MYGEIPILIDILGDVGLGCSPISVIGTGNGANCLQQPVCCSNESYVRTRLSSSVLYLTFCSTASSTSAAHPSTSASELKTGMSASFGRGRYQFVIVILELQRFRISNMSMHALCFKLIRPSIYKSQ
jgi:hypothetical protein